MLEYDYFHKRFSPVEVERSGYPTSTAIISTAGGDCVQRACTTSDGNCSRTSGEEKNDFGEPDHQ